MSFHDDFENHVRASPGDTSFKQFRWLSYSEAYRDGVSKIPANSSYIGGKSALPTWYLSLNIVRVFFALTFPLA